MKIVIEKRPVVGMLKTLLGTFHLLDDKTRNVANGQSFHVVDDEGFDNYITIRGDFVVIPALVLTQIDVKRVIAKEEEQYYVDELEKIKAES